MSESKQCSIKDIFTPSVYFQFHTIVTKFTVKLTMIMRHKSLVMTVLFTASSVECRTFTFGHFSLQQPSSRGRKRNKNLNFSVTCIIMNMDFNILFFTRTERRRVLVKRCFLIKKTEQLPLLCCLSVCLSTHDFNFLRSSKCAVWWLYYMSIVRQHRVEWNRNTKKKQKKNFLMVRRQ